ncbi:hypothetical protein [Streptomyces pratensis]|uniref:hypothetical protein n=1 Tax=Streptomyces pratensis TaxID=1169025 RepID=UPI003015F72E
MARFEHTVTVAAVDRDRFEEAAGALVDLFDASRERGGAILLPDGRPVHGLRLLKGRHLEPGARYGERPDEQGPDEEGPADGAAGAPEPTEWTVLREWRPSRAVEVENFMAEEGVSVRVRVRLREPRGPRALDVTLDGHNPGGGSLYRFSGRVGADLRAWWAAVERPLPAGRAPVVGRAAHRLGKARLTVVPRPAEDGCWRVSVVLSVRGRWLLRPVVAVALALARGRVERKFGAAVDSAAAGWAVVAAQWPSLRGAALRAEIADALTGPPGLPGPPEEEPALR